MIDAKWPHKDLEALARQINSTRASHSKFKQFRRLFAENETALSIADAYRVSPSMRRHAVTGGRPRPSYLHCTHVSFIFIRQTNNRPRPKHIKLKDSLDPFHSARRSANLSRAQGAGVAQTAASLTWPMFGRFFSPARGCLMRSARGEGPARRRKIQRRLPETERIKANIFTRSASRDAVRASRHGG